MSPIDRLTKQIDKTQKEVSNLATWQTITSNLTHNSTQLCRTSYETTVLRIQHNYAIRY